MRHTLDPELADAFGVSGPPVPRGDWAALRELGNAGQAYVATLDPPSEGVARTRHTLTTAGGATIELRWYRHYDAVTGPAVVYAHGGGMVLGTLDAYDRLLDAYAERSRVPFLSVGYALTLAQGGVPIELHVHPGAPHGFDRLAPGAAVTGRAYRDRIRVLASI